MEITNLGKADGLPPVDWAAVVEKLDARSAPDPDAVNSRTTWLPTINEDATPHLTALPPPRLDGPCWLRGLARLIGGVRLTCRRGRSEIASAVAGLLGALQRLPDRPDDRSGSDGARNLGDLIYDLKEMSDLISGCIRAHLHRVVDASG